MNKALQQPRQFLRVRQEGALVHIELARPKAGNAINLDMCQELGEVLLHCEGDAGVRALLLTGSGSKFCVGGDVGGFGTEQQEPSEVIRRMLVHLHDAYVRLARMDAPVVVAVNGAAAGVGLSLVALGDYVLAGESAIFTSAYTAVGLSPDGGSSYFLPRVVGLSRAKEMFLTNRRLDAQEALQWGLVNRVVADQELQAEAQTLAKQLSTGATAAYGAVKNLLLGEGGLESQMEREARYMARAADSPDGREGVAAFQEKRSPSFQGSGRPTKPVG